MACDFVHHDGGLGDAEAGAAILLRHRDPEPARIRHCTMEFERKHAVVVASQPVVVAEPRHDGADAFPDRGMIVRRHELVGRQ
jgi:hypothetical protein